MTPPLILLTNDDGIESPGLAAAAAALSPLGELLIIAPNEQQTSMSRSRSQQHGADGRIRATEVHWEGQSWQAYGAKATPALCVAHAVQEIAARPIALTVSGINYGENVGSCVTVSGTIGAALESADNRIPALAVSLELTHTDYHSYDTNLNFNPSIHFTRKIAQKMLSISLPDDVDVIKMEIPALADENTKIVTTRQDKFRYYVPDVQPRENIFEGPGKIKHRPQKGLFGSDNTDAYAMAKGYVSITPLSIDLTSRVLLEDLANQFGTETL